MQNIIAYFTVWKFKTALDFEILFFENIIKTDRYLLVDKNTHCANSLTRDIYFLFLLKRCRHLFLSDTQGKKCGVTFLSRRSNDFKEV